MRKRIIVSDSQSMDQITIDNVEANVWSELDSILSENGITIEGKSVYQGASKNEFKQPDEPVLQQPVLYVYLYPSEVHSGVTTK